MAVRGVRGATTVRANDAKAIFDGTAELLRVLTELNGLRPDDIGYVWFTVTADLDAAFPADAARAGLGWTSQSREKRWRFSSAHKWWTARTLTIAS